ncbi:HNH endonuclease signature motif containing protein [Brachybacterium phenoliresistens]
MEQFVARVPLSLARGAIRRPVSREALPGRAGVEEDPVLAGVARTLWDLEVQEGPLLARKYFALHALSDRPDEAPEPGLEGDCGSLIAAEALRVSASRGAREVADGYTAVEHFPGCLTRLEGEEFPAFWFREMIRMTRTLRHVLQQGIDEVVAGWDLHCTPKTFFKNLRALVAWAESLQAADEAPVPVERGVRVQEVGGGMSCMTLTGPTPEVYSAARRLDVAARAVQAQQRAALAAGGEVPWDPDGMVREDQRPMSLATLRFLLATRGQVDTDGVEVPADRFRITVTVPILSLLGVSEAPGMLDGMVPVPADLARTLAAGEEDWYRVLTDPVSGAFVKLPAATYRPTAAMREHLRLRGSQCAVPGCGRPVSLGSECDHIEEFLAGGATDLENLHWLCRFHHQEKTDGVLDPVRIQPVQIGPDGVTRPGRTRWLIGSREGHHVIRDVVDDVDLIGTMTVKHLMDHYQDHQGVLCGQDCRHFGRPIPPDEDDDPDDPPTPDGQDPGGGDDPGGGSPGGKDPGGSDPGDRGGGHGESGEDDSGHGTGGHGGGAGVRPGRGDDVERPRNDGAPSRATDASTRVSPATVDPADPWGIQQRRKRNRDSGTEGGLAFPFGSDGPPPF